jgi:UPF0755 protein
LKKIYGISISLIMISFLIASFFLFYIIKFSNKHTSSTQEAKIINIQNGESFNAILEILHKNNLIANIFKAKIFAYIKGYEKSVKAGEYLLDTSMTPHEIFVIITKGKVYLYKVTIPEGFNLYQIAKVFSKEGFCDEEKFIKLALSSKFAKKIGIIEKNLEGYLFPDTYFFPKNAGCNDIITSMKNRFYSIFSDKWIKESAKKGFSMHEIVTLASIIEKETGESKERRIISSVFHNRLKKNMRLQSDPTVIYGLENFDGNLKKKHLKQYTPYNTYRINGLPPGPIANPGKESLYAAIFPEKTDYYYFVSKKNKTHKFSKNIKEHNKAVVKYQLK